MQVIGTVVTSEFDRSRFEVIYHTDLLTARRDYVHVFANALDIDILCSCPILRLNRLL